MRAYLAGNPVHDRVITAFAEGCGAKLVEGWKYQPSEVAIVFGVRKNGIPQSWARGDIIRRHERDGARVLILETGYVRRGDGAGDYYAAGWGGLNGRADFRNQGSPGDRWELLGVRLRPWRGDTPGPVVVCGQVPWDASVQHHDHRGWCQMVCAEYEHIPGTRVVFRPHPMAAGVNYGLRSEISTKPLAEDLDTASVVVTFNSNAAVEAVIAGVPAVSMDHGSMAFGVTGHAIGAVVKPEREQWANNLAYTQWTPDEMRAGKAWAHLSR